MIRSFRGKSPRIAESAFVSEAAYLIGDIEIGENSSVWPGAVIRADVGGMEVGGSIKIGRNTHIEDNCVVHFTKEIGDNVVLGHGAVVEATKIGSNIVIGDNATVLGYAEIGDFCLIGAGSVVTQGMEIPSYSFVLGVPAEIKGKLTEKQVELIGFTLRTVNRLVEAHKNERE